MRTKTQSAKRIQLPNTMATSKNNESSAKRATGTGARSTMIAKADTTKAKPATVALTVAMMRGNAIKPVQNE